jgi:hypothetical protein
MLINFTLSDLYYLGLHLNEFYNWSSLHFLGLHMNEFENLCRGWGPIIE